MYSLFAMTTHILASVSALEQEMNEDASFLHSTNIRQIKIPGDIIIGGVFPVHAKGGSTEQPCGVIAETRGVHRVEAMLYALDVINSQRHFLRGYKLGALIVDSCSDPAYALNQSLDFVRDMIGSTDLSEYRCTDGTKPETNRMARKNVAAVVGGSYSSVTVQVANLLRLFKIAQVSPASTNADLSDKSRFEFLARTVPSDNYQARAMIDIAIHFNWTYVSLVYSADEYGELGAEAFKKEARKMNICIAIEERIAPKKDAFQESINNLIQKLHPDKIVGARVVVLFVGTEYVPELMLQTSKKMKLNKSFNNKKIIWLASEGWDRNNDAYTSGPRKLAAEGAIVLMLTSERVPSFEELSDDFHPDDKVQFVIDAVFAIAHGLKAMKEDLCPDDTVAKSWISRHSRMPSICRAMKKIDGEIFYQKYLLQVKFEGKLFQVYDVYVVGKRFRFSPEGDGPAQYTILNYQPKLNFHHRRSHGTKRRNDYVVVGQWSEERLDIVDEKMFWGYGDIPISQCSMPCATGYRKQLIKDEMCCWACGKCEDYEFLANESTCVDCGQGWWPTADRASCYNIADVNLKYMRWSSWYSIVPAIFAVFGICLTIAVVIVYSLYNDTPIVKASGRELSFLILASMIMCYAMTFVLISRPSAFNCIGFAFSTLYAALLIKTNRIARIFSHRSVRRPLLISPVSQVLLTALLTGLQLFGSFIWLLIVPPGTRHYYPTRDQVVLKCNVPDHHFLYSLAYDAALIVFCTIYAIKTRKVPENFNETRFIGFTMYTTCVLWLSWTFFFFGAESDFQIQTTSLCLSISMSANVALACIFFPKVWIIIFEKHKNVRKQDGMITKRIRTAVGIPNETAPTQYTSLLHDQHQQNSVISFHSTSSANDTFL